MNAIIMKAELAAYWRFKRQLPIVAVEALNEDLLIVTKQRRLIVCEVKISISDMRVDDKKAKHSVIRTALGLPLFPYQHPFPFDYTQYDLFCPHAFYFGVPHELVEKARAVRLELYPYAGLIAVREGNTVFRGQQVEVVEPAREIHERKVKVSSLLKIVKSQSASIANAYSRLARIHGQTKGKVA